MAQDTGISIGELFAEIGKVKEGYSAVVSEVAAEAEKLSRLRDQLNQERAKVALCERTINADMRHKASTSSKLDEAKTVLEALSAQVQELKSDEVFKKLEELEAIEKREREEFLAFLATIEKRTFLTDYAKEEANINIPEMQSDNAKKRHPADEYDAALAQASREVDSMKEKEAELLLRVVQADQRREDEKMAWTAAKKEHAALTANIADTLAMRSEALRTKLSELQQGRAISTSQFTRVATDAGRLQARLAEQERAITEVDGELRRVQRSK